jgi:hypothetical protein
MEYDTEKLDELVAEYRVANTRRKRREIETKVLELTVWAELDKQIDDEKVHIPIGDWDLLRERIDSDDTG